MKKIQDIEKGMVFDHLTLGSGGKIVEVLKERIWVTSFHPIIVGSFQSSSQGKKDIAKLDGLHLEENSREMSEIAVLSPDATVNWIEQGKVIKKKKAWECVSPKLATDLVECENQNCISWEEAPGKFLVNGRRLTCHYCNREFEVTSTF